MKARHIIGFYTDEQQDWLAVLNCGHTQHVRHQHPWVTNEQGRLAHKGQVLNCMKCLTG